MFFAKDIDGNRVHIDEAKVGQPFFCPACGGKMIQKRGDVNAHHFAHMSNKECDPWYAGKMSLWHKKMQDHFDKSKKEIVVWNEIHTEYHVADVVLQSASTKYVVEFQHSTISKKEFIARSEFYLKCGYKVIWIFDFAECKQPKQIFIAEKECDNEYTRLVWPGKDRIRFLDDIDFSDVKNSLFIFFHISTGQGKIIYSSEDYWPWETWGYVDPFHRYPCFALLDLKTFNKTDDFIAKCFSEQSFFKKLKGLDK